MPVRPSRRLRSAVWLLAGAVALVALAASQNAGAQRAQSAPLQVQASTLTQNGQQLVWKLQLVQPFSPARLATDRRTLCLLLERAASGSVGGQVCVTGPARRSRIPRLLYMPITRAGAGRARLVPAMVTRDSSRALTAAFIPASVGLSYAPLRWQVISTLGAVACAPTPGKARCFTLFPTTPALLRLHTPQLIGCAPAGPSLVHSGPAHAREVALTFDDGPWPQPPPSAFLDVLERKHVPATFFEIGRQIASYDPRGAYERRMLVDGDMIGDHTWSHPDMALLPASEQRAQLLETAAAIRKATGRFTPCLWRPPYGAISPPLISLARSLGFLTIMWDVDPHDWETPGVAAIYDNVVGHAHDGAIVLQHFGGGPRYQTLAALPEEIDALRHEGYAFVTIPQMLGVRLIYR